MECGVLTPLLSLCLAWQRTQKKNSKKQEKQRNKSGVTSPHSIKNATAKRASEECSSLARRAHLSEDLADRFAVVDDGDRAVRLVEVGLRVIDAEDVIHGRKHVLVRNGPFAR